MLETYQALRAISPRAGNAQVEEMGLGSGGGEEDNNAPTSPDDVGDDVGAGAFSAQCLFE